MTQAQYKVNHLQQPRGPLDFVRDAVVDVTEPDAGSVNQGEWTEAEIQLLLDGSLSGDQWKTWMPLVKSYHRLQQDVLNKESALIQDRLPEMWLLTRPAAYKAVRARTHEGEEPLKDEEWKELVIWVRNGYVGLNPAVFHYSRSSERLRQEVRVLQECDEQAIDRVGQIFLAERATYSPAEARKLLPTKTANFQSRPKQKPASIAKQMATKAEKRKRGEN